MASGIGEAVSPSREASVRGMAPHAGPSPSSAPDGATAADGDQGGEAEIRTRFLGILDRESGIMGRASAFISFLYLKKIKISKIYVRFGKF